MGPNFDSIESFVTYLRIQQTVKCVTYVQHSRSSNSIHTIWILSPHYLRNWDIFQNLSFKSLTQNDPRSISRPLFEMQKKWEVLVHSLKWGQSSSNLFFTWKVYCALNFCASQHCKTAMQQLIRANLYGN